MANEFIIVRPNTPDTRYAAGIIHDRWIFHSRGGTLCDNDIIVTQDDHNFFNPEMPRNVILLGISLTDNEIASLQEKCSLLIINNDDDTRSQCERALNENHALNYDFKGLWSHQMIAMYHPNVGIISMRGISISRLCWSAFAFQNEKPPLDII